jgi:hypothetical protein
MKDWGMPTAPSVIVALAAAAMTAALSILIASNSVAQQSEAPALIESLGLKVCVRGQYGERVCRQVRPALAEFPGSYAGPPTDPKVFEEQQKKLHDELQRRSEARKQMIEGWQSQLGR